MIHEIIDIRTENSEAKLYTYFLNNSPEIDSNRKRPTVIICPGGGYEFTSDREAEPIAIRMMAIGFNACVLRYSVHPATFPTALLELSMAVSLIRQNAEQWHVDKNKIIVVGFSAGGHLAASLGVFWNRSFLSESLGISNDEIKPNGILLSYPVITSGPYRHKDSFTALLGENHDKSLQEVSLENHVSTDTPPTFLWHTYTDEPVPVENSFLFANALLKHKVHLEMHIYPNGIHGLSLGTEETKEKNNEWTIQPEVANWIEMAGRWIKGL
ncbi:alpha/beta hydrolase [Bacillus sp. CGMCC 1.60114]|uniref:alpha/beta hydrolase n=1 Tax=Bacillus TaxID=1386 RepID=UPI0015730551|nr:MULTISPECIES: alpha/beta hydrolase [Bacillus]MBC6973637.1 alpha/beta hydrolase [Bacillus sp. Xin]MBY0598924.1 alpha/beta hydrolase [Bacillus bingmayongensis]NSW39132.1 alpha/beta hydrolase [Bacillus sp. Xin1]